MSGHFDGVNLTHLITMCGHVIFMFIHFDTGSFCSVIVNGILGLELRYQLLPGMSQVRSRQMISM